MGGLLALVMDPAVRHPADPAVRHPADPASHRPVRPLSPRPTRQARSAFDVEAVRPARTAFDVEAAGAGGGSRGTTAGQGHIDCLVTRHPHLPRDRMGHRLNGSGRSLIIEALAEVYGVEVTARDLARDEHKRWRVPAYGLTVSVAHCDEFSAVVLSSGPRVGVDLQDERDRPAAMRWLGTLLGRAEPAVIRDFAECEALIKASHVTKETFDGVRLPAWQPGWRPTNVPSYQVRSAALGPAMHLALAADTAVPVRWWWQPSRTEPATRTDVLTLEPA
ncbi:hypothetical protein ACFVYF_06625 [Streptomyces sp. NPDC058274]|uniref:hypothetical protein n=1 Tax=Streptomyces sp. NPDC058274 TaxID=3346416 RepID=UPI0036EABCAD